MNRKRTDRGTLLLLTAVTVTMMTLQGCRDEWEGAEFRSNETIVFTTLLHRDGQTSRTRGGLDRHLEYEEEEWMVEEQPVVHTSATRGEPLLSLSGEAGLYGYAYDKESAADTPFLANANYRFVESELVTGTNTASTYWNDAIRSGNVENDSLTLYAYAPYTVDFRGNYTVEDEVARQTDLIVAKSGVPKERFRQPIPLTFEHALTAVKFSIGFECKVRSLTVSGVCNSGTYALDGTGWSGQSGTGSYTFTFGDDGTDITFAKNESKRALTDGKNTLLMIPQTLTEAAKVVLTYDDGETLTVTLDGVVWKPGKMITYTLYKKRPDYIYFDLAAGNVQIAPGKPTDNGNTGGYRGYVYVNGVATYFEGEHQSSNIYYVYQSSELEPTLTGKAVTGWEKTINDGTCRIPSYAPVKKGTRLWRDFITNNTSVESVIEAWDNAGHTAGAAWEAGRQHSPYRIAVSGSDIVCNLTIDNLYSSYQEASTGRTTGGISFLPKGTGSKLALHIMGDNRFGCIHYANTSVSAGHQLILGGSGSLTVADVDFKKKGISNDKYAGDTGYYSNHWCSAIGNSDSGNSSYGIVINSGTIFAGTTKAENCTAIGGGGNGVGEVTITGGLVTAVATTTGTAIGGGIGFTSFGGEGIVTISGGNIYAYNHANRWDIPSAAIGGGGSSESTGTIGSVTISGGNVYAVSALGTAIGGGSSRTKSGGEGLVTISGGTVVAKSIAAESGLSAGTIIQGGAGIGGGTGGSNSGSNGGQATVTISGNPLIRTGSIGGGETKSKDGKIGTATITVSGGDIQAQFVMAKGADQAPTFDMSGGVVRNSHTNDEEFHHIKPYGGAVYLEMGTFTMKGGTIHDCSALQGGAVYIKGTSSTKFIMEDGKIMGCTALLTGDATDLPHGGALYLEGGAVELTGGSICDNLSLGGHGGGVYIMQGSFCMSQAATTITGNSALCRNGKGGNGGALYVTSVAEATEQVHVDLLSGNITGNTADRLGGGVCVDMKGLSVPAEVQVGMASGGPLITDNHAGQKGGGLYAEGVEANIIIDNGSIADNTTSAYVANEDVANEGGMVTLNNTAVTPSVTVTFYVNDGKEEAQQQTATQNIVTATNSLLVAPSFTRVGHRLIGWNTRSDGFGTSYSDGQSMNISLPLKLYAQWAIE